jgi:tRNA (guanine-N7-)-methyltransferase
MLEILEASSETFANLAGPDGFSPRPETRPLTRFEQRGERLGHRVLDLMFRRR